MLKSMLKFAQKTVNDKAGNNYREIYLKRYPQDEHCCAGCNNIFPTSRIQVDHIIPQKHGGSNIPSNLQAMCGPCNREKSAKIDRLSMQYSGAALLREIKKIYG